MQGDLEIEIFVREVHTYQAFFAQVLQLEGVIEGNSFILLYQGARFKFTASLDRTWPMAMRISTELKKQEIMMAFEFFRYTNQGKNRKGLALERESDESVLIFNTEDHWRLIVQPKA